MVSMCALRRRRSHCKELSLLSQIPLIALVYLVFLMTLERHEGRGNILRARTRANYNPPYFSLPYFSLA